MLLSQVALAVVLVNFAGAEKSIFDSRTKAGNQSKDRIGKLLPVFQVVRFPNDPCEIAGGSKNGTCYTDEECTNIGGTNGGSCASGFGVCCIVTLTCGSTSTQNCTYFEVSSPLAGQCRAQICKSSSSICSIRLDFLSFTITGPTTVTTSSVTILNGAQAQTAGFAYAETGRCLTDKFTVSNQVTLPEICGTNSGYHVYFEASGSCNSLDFALGAQAVGATIPTRSWNIKVSQIDCMDRNLPPAGCDQFYTGTLGSFDSFNFGSSNRHLANQHQNICFRREMGFCRICFSADANSDVSVGGWKAASSKASVKGNICCAYGEDGAAKGTLGSYDCIMIPGAQNAAGALAPASQCGNKAGLVVAMAADATGTTTVCSRSIPFRFEFFSDAYEMSAAAGEAVGGTSTQHGFQVTYFQTAC